MNINQAKALRQGQTVYHITKKNADGSPMRARVTSVKTWKRSPERVEVRIKRGLYEYATFTESEISVLTADELEATI